MLKRYIGFTGFLYLGMALVLFVCVDAPKAKIQRIDHLLAYANYPLTLNVPGAKVDQLMLYRALTYYKILTELHPELSQADEMVGYCYFFLKEYSSSERWLKKAIRKHPERIWAVYNLGVVAYREGDFKRAIHYFQEITDGDSQVQTKAAVVSSLSRFSEDKRQFLLRLIPVFIEEIRQKSLTQGFENDGLLMLHPWWQFFSPGQESLY